MTPEELLEALDPLFDALDDWQDEPEDLRPCNTGKPESAAEVGLSLA